jgi:hypothetical protein
MDSSAKLSQSGRQSLFEERSRTLKNSDALMQNAEIHRRCVTSNGTAEIMSSNVRTAVDGTYCGG